MFLTTYRFGLMVRRTLTIVSTVAVSQIDAVRGGLFAKKGWERQQWIAKA
jgi:hypothetical protein